MYVAVGWSQMSKAVLMTRRRFSLIEHRQSVRERIKAYAPSVCVSLDAGDSAETEAIAPNGPLAQLARSLVSGKSVTRPFPFGDCDKATPEQLRWSATGNATLAAEDGHLRIVVPRAAPAQSRLPSMPNPTPATASRTHIGLTAPMKLTGTDDADTKTRG